MKIKVTYEDGDLKQLIRVDLARQGIIATDADIVLAKGKAEVSVEVSRDDLVAPAGEPTTHAAVTRPDVNPPSTPTPPTPTPPLQVVEGGNNPVDMSDVLGESSRIARQSPGKFPVPERTFIEGESSDFPGDR